MTQSTVTRTGAETTIAAVIFSYNYAQYLRQAIDSLLNQTKPFDQVLIVDDGSTDESRKIIESYGNRVQATYKENSGQLGAAAHVLPLLRTHFVFFLDADDYAEQDACEVIAGYLTGNPVKLQFQLRSVDDNGSLDSVIPAYPPNYTSTDMIADNQIIGFYISPPTSGNVFSVPALRSIPLKQLNPREPFDGTPMLCMPYLGEVRSIAQVIANYRIHGSNYSQQNAPSARMFRRSLEQHRLRWQELKTLVPDAVQPETGTTVIELEAMCLAHPFSGNRVPFSLAWQYVARLSRSAMPSRMKGMLGLYTMALTLLPAKVGVRIIHARRSPGARNPLMKKMLGWLLGVRSTQRR